MFGRSIRAVGAIALGAIVLGASACAAGSGPSREAFDDVRPTSVRLIVQNMNFSDVRLYALRRGARRNLGTVTGKQDREFNLVWDTPDPMVVEIDMVAGPKCFTRELIVDPGDILELQISSHFTATSCRT